MNQAGEVSVNGMVPGMELVTAAKTAMLAAKQRGGNACAVSGREKEITFVSLQP